MIVSDIPNSRIVSWSESEGFGSYREPSARANGKTVDHEGRIITCLSQGRTVIREEMGGSLTTIAKSYDGGLLTSPNDVVVKLDRSIWFTDPDYGYLDSTQGHAESLEQDRNRVYRVDPDSLETTMVSEDFDKPNGIAIAPDELVLYVDDAGRSHGEFRVHRLMAFDVVDDGLENPRMLADVDPGIPDGFRAGVEGNIWISAGDGVQVFSPNGDMLGKIHMPDVGVNLSFGMADNQILFFGATSSIWSIELNIAGATHPNN